MLNSLRHHVFTGWFDRNYTLILIVGHHFSITRFDCEPQPTAGKLKVSSVATVFLPRDNAPTPLQHSAFPQVRAGFPVSVRHCSIGPMRCHAGFRLRAGRE